MPAAPRLLLLSLDRWLHPARLPRALADAGFVVDVCCFADDLILASKHLGRGFVLQPALAGDLPRTLKALPGVLAQAAPDLVIPADGSAAGLLVTAHRRLAADPRPEAQALADLVRRSLGDPARHGELADKHRTTALAAGLGLPVPAQAPCPDADALRAFAAAHGWPVVLKANRTGAGAGVRICADEAQALAALPALEGQVMAQAFVAGAATCFAGVALAGRVLAGTGYRKVESWPGVAGPGSVLDVEPHAGMREAAERLIAEVGHTGFFDVDFVLDAAGVAWLIECNPRTVPATHLGRLTGADQAAALFAALTEAAWAPGPARASRFALFPQELLRDAGSAHLHEAWHDVPWDEPAILQGYFKLMGSARPAGGRSPQPRPSPA